MIVANKAKNPVTPKTRVPTVRRAIGAYLSAGILTLLIVGFTTRFYGIDLSIPTCYSSDTGFYLMLIKGLINKEWYPFFVPSTIHLGAPFGSSLYDFPGVADSNLMFLILKCITFFTHDLGRVYNYYGLVTYFLTVFTSIFALRHYRVSYKVAIAFSLLFSFLPYHFMRLLGHLNIALYVLVPLWVLILTWIWSRKPIFFKCQNGRYELDLKNYKSRVSLIVLGLSGTTAIYYNFFFCLFASVAGISAAFYRRSRYPLIVAFMLIAIVGASAFANLAPYIKYRIENGRNRATAVRSHVEAEFYGLKIVQLLLPTNLHRIGPLARITDKYYGGTEVTESSWATLGAFGSAGFLFLLFYFLSPMRSSKSIYYKIGLLVLVATLFATVGGFASLFALLVFPILRSYNRICIFIAYMSLLPVAFAVNRYQRYLPRWVAGGVIASILFIGILDQTTSYYKYTFSHEDIRKEYLSDQAFIKAIESTAPPNALIFQLPYLGFPESGSINEMSDYDPFKGYFHSDTLNWSYGAIKGRLPGHWYEYTSDLPLDQMLYNLSIAGFSGIYIDLNGYKDKGAAVESKLAEMLHKQPLVSQNQRLAYFDMTAFRQNILSTIDQAALENLKQSVLYPTEDRWEGECSGTERNGMERWRWCGNEASVMLINHSSMTRRQRLIMDIHPSRPEPYTLVIQGKDFSDELTLEGSTKKYERVIEIPAKGNAVLSFYSDGEPVILPDDPRRLVFAIYNMELLDLSYPHAEDNVQDNDTILAWEGEFFPPERNAQESWRWCGNGGKVTISNRSDTDVTKQMSMEFRPNRPEPYELVVQGQDFREVVSVDKTAEFYQKTITIPAQGSTTIEFHSDAKPIKASNESRKIVFAVYNFKLRDAQDNTADTAAIKARIKDIWEGEFFPIEKNEKESWRWCGNDGQLILANPTHEMRKQWVSMEFHPNRPDSYQIVIRSKGFRREVVKVTNRDEKFERLLLIPANGKLILHFHSNAKPLITPNESRKLVFAVYNFELNDVDESK